jgi:VWFA-related protein
VTLGKRRAKSEKRITFNDAAARLLGAVLFSFLVLHLSLSGQSLPIFRVGTTLVEFTVVATDTRGNPVRDLRKDEIAILEDEVNREPAFFQFEGASGFLGVTPAPGPLPDGTLTNRAEYAPGVPRQLVAIVLDFVNATREEQFELRAQFLHYLNQVPKDAQVGLYVLRDNAVAVHDFTQDTGTLRNRLQKGELDVYARALAGTGDMQKLLAGARPEQVGALSALAQANARAVQDFNVHIVRERRKKTLSALDSVGSHMAAIPGRKSLVWISQGFPLTSQLEASYVDDVRDTSRRLASQDVAVYPVEAGGLRASRENPTMSGRIEGTSEVMASITGGRATRNNNDLTLGLAAAAQDGRGAYSVGFYAPANPDNRWHEVKVKVSRPGVIVRHRQGYFAASVPASQAAWSEEQWNDIAYRPLISTAVQLDMRATLAGRVLKVALDVKSDDLYFRQAGARLVADVDIAVVEKVGEPTNVRVQSASIEVPSQDTLPATVPAAGEFTLNPQTTSVRVIVRDKSTGRYGSVDLPLAKLTAPQP